jgi:hypothetical protein
MKVIKGYLSFCLAMMGFSAHALDGWEKTKDGHFLVYLPKDNQKGSVFLYMMSGSFICMDPT